MISDFLDNGKDNTCFASNANAIIPAAILAAYEVSCRVAPAHPLSAFIDVYKSNSTRKMVLRIHCVFCLISIFSSER